MNHATNSTIQAMINLLFIFSPFDRRIRRKSVEHACRIAAYAGGAAAQLQAYGVTLSASLIAPRTRCKPARRAVDARCRRQESDSASRRPRPRSRTWE